MTQNVNNYIANSKGGQQPIIQAKILKNCIKMEENCVNRKRPKFYFVDLALLGACLCLFYPLCVCMYILMPFAPVHALAPACTQFLGGLSLHLTHLIV